MLSKTKYRFAGKNLSKIVSTLLLLQISIFAQAPDTLWTKIYGGLGNDWGYTVENTLDGGYIIVGITESFGAGNTDVWLLKLNSTGDTIWTRTYGGVEDDEGWCVQQTYDGGYIISGHTESFGGGNDDIWLVKTDELGDIEWSHTYGGVEDNENSMMRQTSDSGYIILGDIESLATGNDDIWLIKTNNDGDTIWTKTFGDSLDDDVGSIDVTSDGGYIITVTYESIGTGDENIWLIKTDEFGNTVWTKSIGGSQNERVTPNSVRQTFDGGYIVFASTQSLGAGGEDVWLIKTNELGDTSWTKNFGGMKDDVSICGHQTTDGGYIILARTSSFNAGQIDLWLIRTDSNGNLLWMDTFGGLDYDIGMTIQCTSDYGYIVTGATASFGSGGTDLWLIRLEPDSTTEIVEIKLSALDYELSQNFPNPFNPSTTIKYSIPQTSKVVIKVFDVLGNEIKTLVNEEKSAGEYEVEFNGAGLPSGIYFYQLNTGQYSATKNMILLK
jgi:predicted secreted protein